MRTWKYIHTFMFTWLPRLNLGSLCFVHPRHLVHPGQETGLSQVDIFLYSIFIFILVVLYCSYWFRKMRWENITDFNYVKLSKYPTYSWLLTLQQRRMWCFYLIIVVVSIFCLVAVIIFISLVWFSCKKRIDVNFKARVLCWLYDHLKDQSW